MTSLSYCLQSHKMIISDWLTVRETSALSVVDKSLQKTVANTLRGITQESLKRIQRQPFKATKTQIALPSSFLVLENRMQGARGASISLCRFIQQGIYYHSRSLGQMKASALGQISNRELLQKELFKMRKFVSSSIFDLPLLNRGNVLACAAQYTTPEVIKFILKTGFIHDIKIHEATMVAVSVDKIENVALLLSHRNLPMILRATAVMTAVEAKNTEMTKLLLASGKISMMMRGLAIRKAVNLDSVEIVRQLVARGSTYPVLRNTSLVAAAKGGNLEMVRLILQLGSISKEHRFAGFRAAKRRGSHEIVSLLRNHS